MRRENIFGYTDLNDGASWDNLTKPAGVVHT